MPKIRTFEERFKGERVKVSVNYQPSNQLFTLDVPNKYHISGFKINGRQVFEIPYGSQNVVITGKSEPEMMAKFNQYVEMYNNNSNIETTKIIRCRYYGGDRQDNDFHLSFDYSIYNRVKCGQSMWYESVDDNGEVSREHLPRPDSEDVELEWSQEREDFLKRLRESFNSLHAHLQSFLGDSEILTKAIDSQVKLLPHKSEDK